MQIYIYYILNYLFIILYTFIIIIYIIILIVNCNDIYETCDMITTITRKLITNNNYMRVEAYIYIVIVIVQDRCTQSLLGFAF